MQTQVDSSARRIASLERQLRKDQEALANLLVERRIERAHVASLELRIQELEMSEARLRAAVRQAKQTARKERAARGPRPRRPR